jgi:uncharacterized membrane protein YesL
MAKLFDMTNPFWSFIGKLLDVVVLHLLWAVCCLPVVTFGASTTALCYVMMKEASDRGSHYYRMFFKAFRDNLFKGSVIGLVFLILEGGLAYTVYLTSANIDLNPSFPAIRVIAIIFAVLVLMMFEFVFALQARFENSIPRTLLNGFLFSIRHLGWSIVMTVIFIGFYAALIYFMQYVFPLIAWGFGLIVFICSFMMNHILEPYEKMALQHDGVVSTDPEKWDKEKKEEVLAALAEAEATGVWPPASQIGGTAPKQETAEKDPETATDETEKEKETL